MRDVLANGPLPIRDAASPSVLPHGEAKGRGALEGAPSPDGAPFLFSKRLHAGGYSPWPWNACKAVSAVLALGHLGFIPPGPRFQFSACAEGGG